MINMTAAPNFTVESAKAALNEILTALSAPENVKKISEAKENSGNEMLKMMQFVFPIVIQIQMDVIKNYGFSEGREGPLQFLQCIRTLEREDPEIGRLHNQIRAYFLPPVASSPSGEASL
ncbi:protein C10 [Fopius arisanus]|uniref:Protein C10 n=1 Tax=Fopius arisanus TaxID=64838 RepID=A0A9R1UAF3_9HYME|nr:PREDICTED: protein C10 [Fopius arisanus]XP_011313444.1 PREDICTED: protein C10 [Fopius arisanus]